MIALFGCEVRKLVGSGAFLLVALAGAALMLATVLSPSAPPGGPLFMVAGDDLLAIGSAIGFIGNQIDPGRVTESAARTAFVYTPLWVAIVIVFAGTAFSRDFVSGAAAVSRARGMSAAKIVVPKLAAAVMVASFVYVLFTSVCFMLKAIDYGVAPTAAEALGFLALSVINALLCGSLACQVALLFLAFRSSFVSVLVPLLYGAVVLIGYPSSFAASGGHVPNLLFDLSPVFYLFHTCSLGSWDLIAHALTYSVLSMAALTSASVLLADRRGV
ncbi:hypothetical protein HLV35_02715 [Eggerthellaceae bacterium zg-997]|nr:hypothetical protein [Eggerthellaceae bacterium zg-997]